MNEKTTIQINDIHKLIGFIHGKKLNDFIGEFRFKFVSENIGTSIDDREYLFTDKSVWKRELNDSFSWLDLMNVKEHMRHDLTKLKEIGMTQIMNLKYTNEVLKSDSKVDITNCLTVLNHYKVAEISNSETLTHLIKLDDYSLRKMFHKSDNVSRKQIFNEVFHSFIFLGNTLETFSKIII